MSGQVHEQRWRVRKQLRVRPCKDSPESWLTDTNYVDSSALTAARRRPPAELERGACLPLALRGHVITGVGNGCSAR
jgi:hypothetical protein